MTKHLKAHANDILPRQGEGFIVDAQVLHSVRVGGVTTTKLSVRADGAPAPDRRYVADIFAVHPTIGGYRFLFSQVKLGGKALRSLVIITMGNEPVRRFLGALKSMSAPPLEEIVRAQGLEPEVAATIDDEPEQTISLNSNVVTTAVSSGDAAMDFYQVSPFAFHAMNNGGKLQINGVVRVEVRVSQLLGMMNTLADLGAQPLFEGE
jgi:hypothetical protein